MEEGKKEGRRMTPHAHLRNRSVSFVGFGALVLSLVISVPVRAQVAGGTLTGTVTDSSGAAIPGAKITIRDVATGIAREISTDAAGLYSAPNLLPGSYEVRHPPQSGWLDE
jgi:protocatechuate 3,4-dioxygenase beta subunit